MRKVIKYLVYILIAINFVYALSGAIHYPLSALDVYSIWLLKAKHFYYEGILPLSDLNKYPYSHPQYPILLPLAFTYFYKLVGNVNELFINLVYPFIYLWILYLAHKMFLKLKISENISLVLTYIYSMFGPLLAGAGRMHAGEADIFLVLIYWGILHLTFNYFKDKKSKWYFGIAILIAIASQIKMEGVFSAIIFLFLLQNLKDRILLIAISTLPSFVWIYISISSGVISDFGYFAPNILEIIVRITIIFLQTIKEMANYKNWYIFWPIFWFSMYLKSAANNTPFPKLVRSLLITMIILYASNYIFNTQETLSYSISSIDRVTLQLSPYFFTLFALEVSKIKFRRSLPKS